MAEDKDLNTVANANAAADPGATGAEESKPAGKCGGCFKSGDGPRGKLHCFNYLADVPGGYADDDMVEVQFKNTRKGYYKNSTNIDLAIGDMVAVEASPGHDIGQVTLTGALVRLQMRKANIKPDAEIRRIFRKARPNDLEKYEEARARENDTMIRSRKIAESLKLNMKIGDVEYQGDGNKAIFYYIADERVDFRQLIKILADTFKVRIEMKQIGARQEAGRIGGIGPCGRPLCCSSWMTNFVSVATSAARFQDISLNPQKLAGQCAKLKCCLNFEVDTYVESLKKLPEKNVRLETADSTYYHFKTDVFKREITYSTDKNIPANLVTISAGRAFEIIAMNKAGEKPLQLQPDGTPDKNEKKYNDILDQNNLNRFDNKKKKKRRGGSGANGANAGNQEKAGGGDNKPRNNDRQGGERQDRKQRPDKQQRQQQGQRQRRDNNRQPQQGNAQQQAPRPEKPSQPEQ
ncbi:MAG: hypothetical protein K2N28_06580 [Muribaculaceae bacterium]|nr:hypothetical protein [Muribaculaceae bacterium]